jgi:hypothetical protein
MRASKNNRNDTVSDVRLFLEREQPERLKTVEVVCSSARRDMDRRAVHVPYRLFCETLRLFPECLTDNAVHSSATGWPQSTSIACWHDCHPFTTMPIPIPKYSKQNVSTGAPTYTVYGVFCSCNCAVAYILERGTYDQQQQLLLFKQMAISVFGIDTDSIFAMEPSPPRIFLQLFGGHLSIDAFRKLSLVARCTLLTPPFISYSMVLEDNARAQSVGGNGQSSGGGGSTGAHAVVHSAGAAESLEVAPITTHTVRGLRRPTAHLTAAAAAEEEEAPAQHSATSCFETFVRAKQTSAAANSDGEQDVVMEEVKQRRTVTPRKTGAPGSTKKSSGAAKAAAQGGGVSASSVAPTNKSEGTLAAYLQK